VTEPNDPAALSAGKIFVISTEAKELIDHATRCRYQ
jgi:hypothetical protein